MILSHGLNLMMFSFAAAFLLSCGRMLAADTPRLMMRCAFSRITEDGLVLPEYGGTPGTLVHRGDSCRIVPGRTGNAIAIDAPAKSRGQAGCIQFKDFRMDFTKPFSIIVTMRFRKDCDYKEFKEIISCSDGDRGPGFRLTCSWNILALRGGDGKSVPQAATVPSRTPVPLGRWFRLAATWDGRTGTLYIDGAKAAVGEFSIGQAEARTLDVGSFLGGYAYPLQGAIDELLVYEGALSKEDACEDYINYLE